MSKRHPKTHASSGRAAYGLGGFSSAGFGSSESSPLSYVQEPLDPSSFTDANLGVIFKNLTKRDSTTKSKALEDLQSALASTGDDLDDAVVETWIKLYPRLTIDNTRRVRQLSHVVVGQVCFRCGKRIAKHLPKIVGAWLAGSFDADRSVIKAANDALELVFPTQEKLEGLRKTFQKSILEYCTDAALHETVKSLSDERTVSVDDAQAVHARVVSTAVAVIDALLASLPLDDLSKQNASYEAIFKNADLWSFSFHSDPSIRRSLQRLVRTCLQKQPSFIEDNLRSASHAYLYKGLASDQTSSAVDYIQTLDALTSTFPSAWTTAYTEGKSVSSRLRTFLKHGSHSGSSPFWIVAERLFRKIPTDALPKSYHEIVETLSAARDGVTSKDERFNASTAWPAYFTLVDVFSRTMSSHESTELLDSLVLPVVRQYLEPSAETETWKLVVPNASNLVSKIMLVTGIPPLIEREWPNWTERLIEIAKTSLPLQSKDFDHSQKSVAAFAERWTSLQRELFAEKTQASGSLEKVFVTANIHVLQSCTSILSSRNGNPYGVAAIIDEQLRACGPHLMEDATFKTTLTEFVTRDVPDLLFSPSLTYLGRCINAMSSGDDFDQVLLRLLNAILAADQPPAAKMKALQSILPSTASSKSVEIARNTASLQDFLANLHVEGDGVDLPPAFSHLLKIGVVPQPTADLFLSRLTESLSLSDGQLSQDLDTLEKFCRSNSTAIHSFITDSGRMGEQLLSTLVNLGQSDSSDVSTKAVMLSSLLATQMGDTATNTKSNLIKRSLEHASSSSISINAVLQLAREVTEEDAGQAASMLPDEHAWFQSLGTVANAPKLSLGAFSALGGAVSFIGPSTENMHANTPHDSDGLSKALRIYVFFVTIFKQESLFDQLENQKGMFMALQSICTLIAQDALSIADANSLWNSQLDETTEQSLIDTVAAANASLDRYVGLFGAGSNENSEHEAVKLFDELDAIRTRNENTPLAYYAALGLAKARSYHYEQHGYGESDITLAEARLQEYSSTKNILHLISDIVGFARPLSKTQIVSRMCNESIVDLTDDLAKTDERRALESLVLINTLFQTQEGILEKVAKTRVVFLVKQITSWLASGVSLAVKAEVCKALTHILPIIGDMYGQHWSDVVSNIIFLWTLIRGIENESEKSEPIILVTYTSMRVYAVLQKLALSDEANEDLVETLQDAKGQLDKGLVDLLKFSQQFSDDQHQPLLLKNELLARQISKIPADFISDADSLFSLIYAPSRAVQDAGFGLLHKYIPIAQEKISLDAALDNKTAQLPGELLSLVREAPDIEDLDGFSLNHKIPHVLRGYLHGWRLVFDHFTGSSFRVKSDYLEQIKDGAYLPRFLDLAFGLLGHSRGRPVNAAKFDVQEHNSDLESDPKKDIQTLLAHLYYLALLNLQGLVKSYFLDIRSRQVSLAIETWTAKYISPGIISINLRAVADWAENTVNEEPEYENMTVKVSMQSREINVGYVVDEQTMAIKVALPETYPLNPAQVVSVSRVAVKEEKWQSWLRNCQGVITFSNGSIIDGLSAWRRNVTGALKGQTECAICYSIISGDKQLPTKRCPTCKYQFHSSCLFKWFKTSNASTCPLCRNAFNFS